MLCWFTACGCLCISFNVISAMQEKHNIYFTTYEQIQQHNPDTLILGISNLILHHCFIWKCDLVFRHYWYWLWYLVSALKHLCWFMFNRTPIITAYWFPYRLICDNHECCDKLNTPQTGSLAKPIVLSFILEIFLSQNKIWSWNKAINQSISRHRETQASDNNARNF